MRGFMLATLFVALTGCPYTVYRCPPFEKETYPSKTVRNERCEAAGKRLTELKCKEARPDFANFCIHMIEHDIPFKPTCAAKISSCAQLESCRGAS